MTEDSLRPLEELNGLVRALTKAGISLDPEATGQRLLNRLDAIDQDLGGGAPPAEAVHDHAADSAYERLAAGWLAGGEPGRLLESNHSSAVDGEASRERMTGRLAYPILVAVLACCGLAGMNQLVLPLVESALADLRQPVRTGVAWLQSVRATTPLWLFGVPAILFVGLAWTRSAGPFRWTRTSRDVGVRARRRLGSQCEAAAALLEAGVEPGSAVESVATPDRAPPLLAWVREAVPAGRAGAEDLRGVAGVYAALASRGGSRSTLVLSMIACVVIGGGATLLYGLALFVPVVELLWTLNE